MKPGNRIDLVMVSLLFLQSQTLWAADNDGLKFYSRFGNQPLSGANLQVESHSSGLSPTLEANPLDLQAGMKYEQGRYQMQLGSRYELGSSSAVLPEQKVHVEGRIRIRW